MGMANSRKKTKKTDTDIISGGEKKMQNKMRCHFKSIILEKLY